MHLRGDFRPGGEPRRNEAPRYRLSHAPKSAFASQLGASICEKRDVVDEVIAHARGREVSSNAVSRSRVATKAVGHREPSSGWDLVLMWRETTSSVDPSASPVVRRGCGRSAQSSEKWRHKELEEEKAEDDAGPTRRRRGIDSVEVCPARSRSRERPDQPTDRSRLDARFPQLPRSHRS